MTTRLPQIGRRILTETSEPPRWRFLTASFPRLQPNAKGIRMKHIDTLQIPFPKNMDALAALDATREIPYLKALCNRRFIHTPGPNPSPKQIIPVIEQCLATHRSLRPSGCTEHTDIFVEWRLFEEDLADFLSQLKSLSPVGSVPSVSSVVNKTASTLPVAHVSRPAASRAFPVAPSSQSEICNLKSEIPKTFGHSNNSNQ